MQTLAAVDTARFARCIAASKRVRWDVDRDVIRERTFALDQKFLPDGLSLVDTLAFLSAEEKRYLSQIQGRTYAGIFGLVERFINAKVLEVSRDHWFGDQVALEALVRFSDEELKHVAVDGVLQAQAAADAGYFAATCGRIFTDDEMRQLQGGVLRAYRWQYILSGAQHPYFIEVLASLIDETQGQRVQTALTTLM